MTKKKRNNKILQMLHYCRITYFRFFQFWKTSTCKIVFERGHAFFWRGRKPPNPIEQQRLIMLTIQTKKHFTWICRMCTFANEKRYDRCEVCSAPSPLSNEQIWVCETWYCFYTCCVLSPSCKHELEKGGKRNLYTQTYKRMNNIKSTMSPLPPNKYNNNKQSTSVNAMTRDEW
ncbi:hypothetical protein RFI_14042 [Reticulomyxa filosa]|uniref:RanBP2-type domain-containing protein n=1 Tax=Reticulomyxa filosa TaxID=46433 RepID=X6NAS1_RETFI|nr:hypothetical protein RFI_14042 [Reticulomyxa filosa]|eukprot:ETO23141.1 hypothetical protein RFI_14042 [Reticulomyxa filosa]